MEYGRQYPLSMKTDRLEVKHGSIRKVKLRSYLTKYTKKIKKHLDLRVFEE